MPVVQGSNATIFSSRKCFPYIISPNSPLGDNLVSLVNGVDVKTIRYNINLSGLVSVLNVIDDPKRP